MMMRVETLTGPAAEPVTLAEAKGFLKQDDTGDDALIGSLITAARQLCEEWTGRRFITQTVIGRLHCFPGAREEEWWNGVREGSLSCLVGGGPIKIPVGPVQGTPVGPIVRYYTDESDTPVVVDASTYYLATEGYGQAILQLRRGLSWPAVTLRERNAVEVELVVGYGDAASNCPSPVQAAILNAVAHLYEQRGDGSNGSLPANVTALLRAYSNVRIG